MSHSKAKLCKNKTSSHTRCHRLYMMTVIHDMFKYFRKSKEKLNIDWNYTWITWFRTAVTQALLRGSGKAYELRCMSCRHLSGSGNFSITCKLILLYLLFWTKYLTKLKKIKLRAQSTIECVFFSDLISFHRFDIIS